jgi:protein-tyrosine phosphatase
VSLLEDDEVAEPGLAQRKHCAGKSASSSWRLPVPDRGASLPSAVSELVGKLVEELRAGRGVGIHCRIGVGRSALLAVCVLAAMGVPVESAWASVQRARGLSVPDTPTQRSWVAIWSGRSGNSPATPRD